MFRASITILILCPALAIGQQGGPELRAELAQIDYRHPTSLDDYLVRCDRVRTLVPKLEAFYKQAGARAVQLRIANPDDALIQRMAPVYSALNEKDIEGIVLVEQEMALASKMSRLPANNRKAFFDSQIAPLQSREDKIARSEIEIARKAKQEGIPFPDDVSKSLGNSK